MREIPVAGCERDAFLDLLRFLYTGATPDLALSRIFGGVSAKSVIPVLRFATHFDRDDTRRLKQSRFPPPPPSFPPPPSPGPDPAPAPLPSAPGPTLAPPRPRPAPRSSSAPPPRPAQPRPAPSSPTLPHAALARPAPPMARYALEYVSKHPEPVCRSPEFKRLLAEGGPRCPAPPRPARIRAGS
eukprot:tig00000113_g5643.t1